MKDEESHEQFIEFEKWYAMMVHPHLNCRCISIPLQETFEELRVLDLLDNNWWN